MTAIAGCLVRDGSAPERLTATMLQSLAAFGPDDEAIMPFDGGAFGRRLYRTLPEDEFDAQPIRSACDRFVIVADVRIDNRDELIGDLGMERSSAAALSDSAILAAAWSRWVIESLQRMIGDFAAAIWDRQERALTLARSPLSPKSLFYSVRPGTTAFATMPDALLAAGVVPFEIDTTHASAVVAECIVPASTMFRGIAPVPHGWAVRLRQGGEDHVRLWDVERRQFRHSSREFPDALRAEFERAVACRLRRHHGRAASQLSSGRDSSAVTTTAARILARRGEELLALTGAPREAFGLSSMSHRIIDEGALAARTASAHPNVRHVVCRTRNRPYVALFDPLNALHVGPLQNPANLPWWNEIDEAASEAGATVLLVGSEGNLTISAGGVSLLPDLLREQGSMALARQAWGIGRFSPARWRSIANLLLGPALPPSAYRLIMSAAGRRAKSDFQVPLLRQPYRREAEKRLEQQSEEVRRIGGSFEYRRKLLLELDRAEKGTLALWGFDVRDPTADRRIVELCFSAPIEQLVSARAERPGYDAAFGDCIPAEVLRNKSRGLQSADWFESYPREQVDAAFLRYARNPIVEELIDLDHVRMLIEAWPSSGWGPIGEVVTYRNKLLLALSVASFIDQHFPVQ